MSLTGSKSCILALKGVVGKFFNVVSAVAMGAAVERMCLSETNFS